MSSPTPLAFFGFLLAFMLTVAWRMPLSPGQHLFAFGTAAQAAQAVPPPVETIPLPPAPPPTPIPQPILLAPPVAPVPLIAQPASLPNAPAEVTEAPKAKKGRHARKGPRPTEAKASNDDLAGLMSAATDSKPSKKRAH